MNKYIHLSSKTYINEVIRNYEKEHGTLKKMMSPMSNIVHPEMDKSILSDKNKMNRFQKIIGICQWLIVAGRFNICYAVSSLSRFQVAPCSNHIKMEGTILGYLKKFPNSGYCVNPIKPRIRDKGKHVIELKEDFGGQYHYFKEELDPIFPKPLIPEMDISVFLDSDHGHDKKTGRSITGIFGLVGSTPII